MALDLSPLERLDTFAKSASGRNSNKNNNAKKTKAQMKSEYSKLKADFIVEMKQLADLRHPCITTVMGAVTGPLPLLIME